jgi:hypothetical protein
MTHSTNERQCDVFKNDDDIQSMREFCNWLRSGGMASLKSMQQTADDYKRVRDIGFQMIVKAIWGAILLAFGLGGIALLKKYW